MDMKIQPLVEAIFPLNCMSTDTHVMHMDTQWLKILKINYSQLSNLHTSSSTLLQLGYFKPCRHYFLE